MSYTSDIQTPPECQCGRGKMLRHCASEYTKNPGRHYYKCPVDERHPKSFMWCDDYHHLKKTKVDTTFQDPVGGSCSNNASGHTDESINRQIRNRRTTTQDIGSENEFTAKETRIKMCHGVSNVGTNQVLLWCVVLLTIIFLAILLLILGIVVGLQFCQCN